jgi:hypothetical protein
VSTLGFLLAVVLALLTAAPGCVRRSLTVTSDPPGALVYLNGQEFGRTPVTRDFTWYGNYDVALRMEGYETLKTNGKVIAPWWQWVPIDLVAELFPLHDRRKLSYTLKPTSEATVAPDVILSRAEQLRGELQSSRNTREPSTVPTTAPVK